MKFWDIAVVVLSFLVGAAVAVVVMLSIGFVHVGQIAKSLEDAFQEVTPVVSTQAMKSEGAAPPISTAAQNKVEAPIESNGQSNTVNLGDTMKFRSGEVTITNLESIEDGGKTYLLITYTFRNTSDKSVSPYTQVGFKGFQKGVSLDDGVLFKDDYIEQKEIKPGVTLEGCTDTMVYSQTDGPILLEISELFSFNGVKYQMNIEVQ